MRFLSLEQRFWVKVSQGSPDECWPWLAGTYPGGYGKFKIPAGRLEMTRTEARGAHRVAFRLIHGRWPVPGGLHGCDNVLCCNALNPAHVHEGTQAQNLLEMTIRGRRASGAVLATRAVRPMTAEIARELRCRHAEGDISYQTLADETGFSYTLVRNIVLGLHHTERV